MAWDNFQFRDLLLRAIESDAVGEVKQLAKRETALIRPAPHHTITGNTPDNIDRHSLCDREQLDEIVVEVLAAVDCRVVIDVGVPGGQECLVGRGGQRCNRVACRP